MPSDDWTFAALVRKYLGISAWKKAIFYLSFVTILSIVSDMFHMSEHCEYIKVRLWGKRGHDLKKFPTQDFFYQFYGWTFPLILLSTVRRRKHDLSDP